MPASFGYGLFLRGNEHTGGRRNVQGPIRQDQTCADATHRLKEVKSYTRIDGYFRSSIFDLVGEEIAAIPEVLIVCAC
jgi:hypothetical protein